MEGDGGCGPVGERVAIEDLLPSDGDVVVPRGLLELCLGLIENEIDDHDYYSANPGCDDLRLARAQLRRFVAPDSKD